MLQGELLDQLWPWILRTANTLPRMVPPGADTDGVPKGKRPYGSAVRELRVPWPISHRAAHRQRDSPILARCVAVSQHSRRIKGRQTPAPGQIACRLVIRDKYPAWMLRLQQIDHLRLTEMERRRIVWGRKQPPANPFDTDQRLSIAGDGHRLAQPFRFQNRLQ